MLKGGSLLRLQELSLEGKSLREIDRESGFSRNTVRKYLRDGQTHEPKSRPKKGSKLDEYKPTIDE